MSSMSNHPVHPSLFRPPADLIGGEWVPLQPAEPPLSESGGRLVGTSGGVVASRNPAHPSRVVWSARTNIAHVDAAVDAARRAFPKWASASREQRHAVLRRYAELTRQHAPKIAELITDETGKPLWETKGEAGALAAKVDITLDPGPEGGGRRVDEYEFAISPTRTGRTMFRPHGVMAVVAPFNFPAHLPNGHIVPALAMGNTIVLKPSDKTPGTGQHLADLFAQALEAEGWGTNGGGIINLVQGGADVSAALTSHQRIDGILFTGSWPVGRRILEANLDHPGRIVALEMGGNNAAVVMPDADLRQAAIEITRCAFNTTGQRCTSTRRAIIHKDIADRLVPAICAGARAMAFGDPRSSEPVFAGPIITDSARRAVLDFQDRLRDSKAEVLVESLPQTQALAGSGGAAAAAEGWYITPGVARVDRFTPTAPCDTTTGDSASRGTGVGRAPVQGSIPFDAGCDEEVFGPYLRIAVVDSLDDAIEQASATRYGLAASIFTRSEEAARRFLVEARAGCVNVNAGTAGASSKLPFGGLGLSGNHRPAGSFSLDYCAYPVAAMLETGDAATIAAGMTFDDAWLA